MLSFFFIGALCLACCLMAVKATLGIVNTVVETPPTTQVPFGLTGQTNVTSSAIGFQKTLDVNSTKNATDVGYQSGLALVAGAATISLQAIPGLGGVTKDFSNCKIRWIQFTADPTNLNPITIVKGAANPYTGFGANFSVTLDPGKSVLIEGNETIIAGGVKNLDVSGTGTQKLSYQVVVGTN